MPQRSTLLQLKLFFSCASGPWVTIFPSAPTDQQKLHYSLPLLLLLFLLLLLLLLLFILPYLLYLFGSLSVLFFFSSSPLLSPLPL